MFGGCSVGKVGNEGGKVFPSLTNDLYKLDMSLDSEFYWNKLNLEKKNGEQPVPRWKHSATKIDETRIVIFGGFGTKDNSRMNDVWVLDTSTDTWICREELLIEASKSSKSSDLCIEHMMKSDPPCPRGSHSASIIGDVILFFGGYGGLGHTRKDFSDLHVLCLKSWEWFKIETTGIKPQARSGHQSVALDDKIYVMGGWNALEQFDDLHVLDTKSFCWIQLETASGPTNWGSKRWNFTAASAFSVPFHKVFVFGGNSGELDSTRPQGHYCNDVQVLECEALDYSHSNNRDGSINLKWIRPDIIGDEPCPRSDTQMLYSQHSGKLVLFGGWSNRWHDKVYTCNVSQIVGPPYNIFSLACIDWDKVIGPVTGGSKMLFKGKGFQSVQNRTAIICISCPKGSIEVSGEVLDDERVRFVSPNFETYGPVMTEVRLKLGQHLFTNNIVSFSYFSVTDCSETVAFGPGLLGQNSINVSTMFVIQAKDKISSDRTCGMDKYDVSIRYTGEYSSKADDTVKDTTLIEHTIVDNDDGTYLIEYTPTQQGYYEIKVMFNGAFGGRAGAIRGSPFFTRVLRNNHRESSKLDGSALQEHILHFNEDLTRFSTETMKGLEKVIPKEEIKSLIFVKEHLRNVSNKKEAYELGLASNRASLLYIKKKGINVPSLEKTLKKLESAGELWTQTKLAVPVVTERISTYDQVWAGKTRFKIEVYTKELLEKQRKFRLLQFWTYIDKHGKELSEENISESIAKAETELKSELRLLEENDHLCEIFELGELINTSKQVIAEMKVDIKEMKQLWKVSVELNQYIATMETCQWANIDIESLEEGGKQQLAAVKGLHKCIGWSEAFQCVEKRCKFFLLTIPSISLLRSKVMRSRHWKQLIEVTGKSDFVPPTQNSDMQLGDLLSLDLHQISNEVEEICDQAVKEEKMEITIDQIELRWADINFTMTPYKQSNNCEDIPLLGIGEEDFEALENDQLVVQGMLASRFIAQFETEVTSWNKFLFNINEIFILVTDIQKTWSYLEPLFIHSSEVKRELPEDTTRFAIIDSDVRATLNKAWQTKNVKEAFNQEGLMEKLEGVQEQLDLCKKSLADFLDGRRRQFPRYYFVSEADLLDILSNGSSPEKILTHTPKVYLSTKTLVLSTKDKSALGRPIATEFVAGVGSEICLFEPPVALDGKVEIYMQTILDGQKLSIFETVKKSLITYNKLDRSEWVLAKDSNSGRSLCPAQTTLLVLAINYVNEVEKVFEDIKEGNINALLTYAEKQVKQLDDLIQLTHSTLSKGDRTRVMVCITMDAHARDVVQKMIKNKVNTVDSFMWQSQLKHKFRVPPTHARHQDRNYELRGDKGERAEISICDAILPYDYEYLGNGPRLVITPLTDRVYVTATQALNLMMGCAPAGPAGTGKTETTKDLANALAKLIYVINCKLDL